MPNAIARGLVCVLTLALAGAASAEACREGREYQASIRCTCPSGTQRASTRTGFRCNKAGVRGAQTHSDSGNLTTAQVDAAVSAASDSFEPCLDREGYDFAQINLRALVGEDGRVLEASSTRSAPDSARVRDCSVAALKAVQFPRPSGGASAPLTFTLSLDAGRQAPGRKAARRGLQVHAR
jgi:hypothetical protein